MYNACLIIFLRSEVKMTVSCVYIINVPVHGGAIPLEKISLFFTDLDTWIQLRACVVYTWYFDEYF